MKDWAAILYPHVQKITYCGQSAEVACDRRCNKAWGINTRPRDEEGRYLADHELGDAPEDPGTYEGGAAKPHAASYEGGAVSWDGPLNKWCVRECERSIMSAPGRRLVLPGERLVLPKFDERRK